MKGSVLTLSISLITILSLYYLLKTSQSQYQLYKKTHNLKFSFFQDLYREKIFTSNLETINEHNSIINSTYKLQINKFAHLTQQQFTSIYLKTITIKNTHYQVDNTFISVEDVDWTVFGAVTGVKDQGECGSCWAFSTTGALEGLSKISYNILQSFSEQELLDCSQEYQNFGCDGGLMTSAFQYVKYNNISNQESYPYKAQVQECKKQKGTFKISGYTELQGCNQMANALVSRPLAVGVDATNWGPYQSGVFDNCQTNLNHGVLLVGASDKFWKVKNSWGLNWGEKGYIRLKRGNTCGICTIPSYPNK